MSEVFTKSMARNIYYGGAVFFFLLFLVLTFDTTRTLPKSDNRANLTPAVIAGKALWENHNCIGCHTLLGEGAYYAPELGNVYTRRGGDFIKAWIKLQPTGVPGRSIRISLDAPIPPYRAIFFPSSQYASISPLPLTAMMPRSFTA